MAQSYESALSAVKQGMIAHRAGWNGSGQFIFLHKGFPHGVALDPSEAEALSLPEGTVVRFRAALYLKTVQGDIVPWLASQSDQLEDDWIIEGAPSPSAFAQ